MLRAAFVLTTMGFAGVAQAALPALMPMPAKVEAANGKLAIDATFGAGGDVNGVLAPSVKRFLTRVAHQTAIIPAPSGIKPTLTIACQPCTASPVLGEDESYQLEITAASANLK